MINRKFNKRERYLINAALAFQIRFLTSTGDFPEKVLMKKLEEKTNKWIWEIEGSIEDDTAVGE